MSEPRSILVIGGGSWGTTVAKLLAESVPRVFLWVYEKELVEAIATKRENPVFLPGVPLPKTIIPFHDPKEFAGKAEVVVWAAPSHVARKVVQKFTPYLTGRELSVSLVKGIEESSLKTMSSILEEILPKEGGKRVVVLSGPSFAKEVSAGLPTAVVAAGKDFSLAKKVQGIFSGPRFRIYVHTDPLGVELGGALKNVMAIAVGICDGMGMGNNARAALITRGLAEMIRLGVAVGAEKLTFAGLSGIGDLVLTCTGALSRNRSVGLRIGEGESLQEILASMKMVAEGVRTVRAVIRLAEKYQVDMPISQEVFRILYEGAAPRESVDALMSRELTVEWR